LLPVVGSGALKARQLCVLEKVPVAMRKRLYCAKLWKELGLEFR
jgi:hypothetical protein